MIQRFTRLPAIQTHVGLHKNVEIIIAFVIATAIGLWIGCRGRKPEELVSILKKNNLSVDKMDGMKFNLFTDNWSISSDKSVNYIAKFIKN